MEESKAGEDGWAVMVNLLELSVITNSQLWHSCHWFTSTGVRWWESLAAEMTFEWRPEVRGWGWGCSRQRNYGVWRHEGEACVRDLEAGRTEWGPASQGQIRGLVKVKIFRRIEGKEQNNQISVREERLGLEAESWLLESQDHQEALQSPPWGPASGIVALGHALYEEPRD